jgi:hypothetical protein
MRVHVYYAIRRIKDYNSYAINAKFTFVPNAIRHFKFDSQADTNDTLCVIRFEKRLMWLDIWRIDLSVSQFGVVEVG